MVMSAGAEPNETFHSRRSPQKTRDFFISMRMVVALIIFLLIAIRLNWQKVVLCLFWIVNPDLSEFEAIMNFLRSQTFILQPKNCVARGSYILVTLLINTFIIGHTSLEGFIYMKLPKTIYVEHVSLKHISPRMPPNVSTILQDVRVQVFKNRHVQKHGEFEYLVPTLSLFKQQSTPQRSTPQRSTPQRSTSQQSLPPFQQSQQLFSIPTQQLQHHCGSAWTHYTKQRAKRGKVDTKNKVLSLKDYDEMIGHKADLKASDLSIGMRVDAPYEQHFYSAVITSLQQEKVGVRYLGFEGDPNECHIVDLKKAKLYPFQYQDPHHPIQMADGWNNNKAKEFVQSMEEDAEDEEKVEELAAKLKSQRNKCPSTGGVATLLYARALRKSREK